MDKSLHSGAGDLQFFSGDLVTRRLCCAAYNEKRSQRFEYGCFSLSKILVFQPLDGSPQKSKRPIGIKNLFGCQCVSWFPAVTILAITKVDRHKINLSAALNRVLTLILV